MFESGGFQNQPPPLPIEPIQGSNFFAGQKLKKKTSKIRVNFCRRHFLSKNPIFHDQKFEKKKEVPTW